MPASSPADHGHARCAAGGEDVCRILSPPRLMGTLRLWSQLEDAQCSPGRCEDPVPRRPSGVHEARGLSNRGDLQAHHARQSNGSTPARRRSTRFDVAFPLRRSKPEKLTDSASRSATSRRLTGKRYSASPSRSGTSWREGSSMQVTAFSTPARPEWRCRICDYGGEIIEESHDRFLTIAAAWLEGRERPRSHGSCRPSENGFAVARRREAAGSGDGRALSVSASRKETRRAQQAAMAKETLSRVGPTNGAVVGRDQLPLQACRRWISAPPVDPTGENPSHARGLPPRILRVSSARWQSGRGRGCTPLPPTRSARGGVDR